MKKAKVPPMKTLLTRIAVNGSIDFSAVLTFYAASNGISISDLITQEMWGIIIGSLIVMLARTLLETLISPILTYYKEKLKSWIRKKVKDQELEDMIIHSIDQISEKVNTALTPESLDALLKEGKLK